MNKELWTSALTFVAGLIILAQQVLPISPDLVPWLAFGAGALNLALGVFFGVKGNQARKAAKAAAK